MAREGEQRHGRLGQRGTRQQCGKRRAKRYTGQGEEAEQSIRIPALLAFLLLQKKGMRTGQRLQRAALRAGIRRHGEKERILRGGAPGTENQLPGGYRRPGGA